MAEDMPAPEAPPEEGSPKEEGQEDPQQVLQEAAEGVAKAAQLIDKMGSPSMKSNMAKGMEFFGKVIDEASGGSAGGSEPEGQGQVPMQQGMSGVPMGPQTRQ